VAYEKAMAGVRERNPDDHEAAIFHALAILGVAYNSPPDKTYARQKEAAEILNGLLAVEPDHPGIAHYMIHSFDYPELAELALRQRAPTQDRPFGSPRAAHAVAHLHALGNVEGVDRIESRLGADCADLGAKTQAGATAFDALHAMDYLEYAICRLDRTRRRESWSTMSPR